MKTKIRYCIYALLITGVLLSLYLAVGDSFKGLLPESCLSECKAVHESSFGSIWGLPIGYFAAASLLIVLVLHSRRKREVVAWALGAMVGAEAYLTIIQIAFLESLCVWCLVFFTLLVASFALAAGRGSRAVGCSVALGTVLLAHFIAFPPFFSINPNLVQSIERPKIEIFASPSCSHCEQAIQSLESVCKSGDLDLVLRPVSLSSADRQKSIKWVCEKIFDRHNYASRRLAEQVVFKNEQQAKKLSNGQLAVPIIVVTSGAKTQTYKGWNPDIKAKIESMLPVAKNESRFESTVNRYLPNHGEVDDASCETNSSSYCAAN